MLRTKGIVLQSAAGHLDSKVCWDTSKQGYNIKGHHGLLSGQGQRLDELYKCPRVLHMGAGPTHNWGQQACQEPGQLIGGQ